MKNIAKKNYIIIFFIIIISFIIPTYAVEAETESTLEINFIAENNTLPMDNVDISIYKLASFESNNHIAQWQNIYSNNIIDLDNVSDEEIISKAMELSNFVKANNINADYKLTTDFDGKNKITLENGIYLICGMETVKNDVIYTPTPCIIQLPYTDNSGKLIYSASIELKYEISAVAQPTVQPTIQPTPSPEISENTPPRTGDIIQIVVGILILVIALNIIQILIQKNKKNNK